MKKALKQYVSLTNVKYSLKDIKSLSDTQKKKLVSNVNYKLNKNDIKLNYDREKVLNNDRELLKFLNKSKNKREQKALRELKKESKEDYLRVQIQRSLEKGNEKTLYNYRLKLNNLRKDITDKTKNKNKKKFEQKVQANKDVWTNAFGVGLDKNNRDTFKDLRDIVKSKSKRILKEIKKDNPSEYDFISNGIKSTFNIQGIDAPKIFGLTDFPMLNDFRSKAEFNQALVKLQNFAMDDMNKETIFKNEHKHIFNIIGGAENRGIISSLEFQDFKKQFDSLSLSEAMLFAELYNSKIEEYGSGGAKQKGSSITHEKLINLINTTKAKLR